LSQKRNAARGCFFISYWDILFMEILPQIPLYKGIPMIASDSRGADRFRQTSVPPEHTQEKGELGDFTTTRRGIPLSLLAIAIGVLSAFVALALLRLIGLFTNLFFFQRWSTAMVSPAQNRLGLWEVFVPVIGALIIGLMARYGSERIRGHGIPEAIE